jgi:hypothetical protein
MTVDHEERQRRHIDDLEVSRLRRPDGSGGGSVVA